MTVTENWISILPAIPLAHAVPFVRIPRSGRMSDLPIRRGIIYGTSIWTCAGQGHPMKHIGSAVQKEAQFVRVDLDDPQGFTYALRWFCSQKIGDYATSEARIRVGTARNAHAATTARIIEHFTRSLWDGPGAITDADRLDLAQAIADMQGPS